MVAETALRPDAEGPGLQVMQILEAPAMSIILRILFVLAGAITALFVTRDALNFTIIQTFVAVLLVTAVVGAGTLWSVRRKS